MHSGYVVCQICESYHDSVEELNAHYERDHPTGSGTEKKFPCKLCDKSFVHRSTMYKHQRKAHGRVLYENNGLPEPIQPNEEGRFPCEFCGKSFTQSSNLYTHQRNAHGRAAGKARKRDQGTVACDVCGKMFCDRWTVIKHMKTIHALS